MFLIAAPATSFANTLSQGIIESYNSTHYKVYISDMKANMPQHNPSSSKTSIFTKSKTICYKNAKGKNIWYIKVTGTFKGKGKAIKCIQSKVTACSYDRAWKITKKSAGFKGNHAIAKATAQHYNNGVSAESITKTVTLTARSPRHFK